MNREQQRQAAQLAFVASGQDIEVGDAGACPLPVEQLMATTGEEDWVVQQLEGGLTAHVFRLRAGGRDWTLKKARERCLVQNVDGQTSFLNEVQRRADISRLQDNPATADRLRAAVRTVYASYRRGIILSPWIEGEPVADWDERRLLQMFGALEELVLAGLFEWDFCPGNVLDDGHIRLFDFGYMYRFDPLLEFNSNGRDTPLFHAAERFETRNFFAFLLRVEQEQGMDAALSALRLEKQIALESYQRLLAQLVARGVHPEVRAWLEAIIARWQQALRYDLSTLYLTEGWRSHRLDLMDDLHGHSCTPATLRRLDWLEQVARDHQRELRQQQALFWDDATLDAAQLLDMLQQSRQQALAWQV